MSAYDELSPENRRKVDELLADTEANNGLAPVDLDQFWADQKVARQDPFGANIPQPSFGAVCNWECLFEELGIDIEVGPIRHAIFAPYETFNILLLAYDCRVRHGTPRTLGCMDVRWADLKELTGLSMPPADQQIRQELLRRGLWGFDAA